MNKILRSDRSTRQKVGHYSQMVWANTTLVGCGTSEYDITDIRMVMIVCNYAPTGNYLGEEYYERKETDDL